MSIAKEENERLRDMCNALCAAIAEEAIRDSPDGTFIPNVLMMTMTVTNWINDRTLAALTHAVNSKT